MHAVALFRRLSEPFEHLDPDWAKNTEGRLELIESVVQQVAQ